MLHRLSSANQRVITNLDPDLTVDSVLFLKLRLMSNNCTALTLLFCSCVHAKTRSPCEVLPGVVYFHLAHRVSLDFAYEASLLLWHSENADRWQGQSCWAAIACDNSAVTQCFLWIYTNRLNVCDKTFECSRSEADVNVWWNIIPRLSLDFLHWWMGLLLVCSGLI